MGSELTPEVLADLRAKAEKATPGPWPENYVWGAVRHIARNVDRSLFCDDAEDATFNWNRYTDGHYIVAANPATVLALLDEIERLRADDSRRRDIDLDVIENIAEAELADARQMCHDNCPPHCTDWVRVSIEAHALLAMVRAVRAAMDLRPPIDQSILGTNMTVDQRAVGEFNAALAPFRKEATESP